jgi:hypothetical protein
MTMIDERSALETAMVVSRDAREPVRLAELVPEAMANDAVDAVLAHVDVMLTQLFPPTCTRSLQRLASAERRSGRRLQLVAESSLGRAVCDLTVFAQTGAGDLAAIPGAIHAVLEAAYTTPASAQRVDDPGERIDREQLPGPLGVVLRAALARYRIEVGADVRSRELALLGGVDEAAVQNDVAVPASLARQWLATHGISGFAPA